MKTKTYSENEMIDDLEDDLEDDLDEEVSLNEESDELNENEDSDEIDEPDDVILDDDLVALYDVIPKKKKRVRVKKEEFYVEPKKFDEEIMRYYDSGILTDELADMVSKIAHKLSYASNFINYTYREDMVGDALIRMFKALMSKKYDRVKGTNPFSYFTRIAFNAFRNRIKKEKHINETHLRYQEELTMISENQNIFKNKKNLYGNDQK
jgi:hypothetical protein